MKANEAPEKIYIHEASAPELTEKLPYHVEYTRTDAFIDKALKFLDEYFFFNNRSYIIESDVFDSKKEMLEEFKKYVEK